MHLWNILPKYLPIVLLVCLFYQSCPTLVTTYRPPVTVNEGFEDCNYLRTVKKNSKRCYIGSVLQIQLTKVEANYSRPTGTEHRVVCHSIPKDRHAGADQTRRNDVSTECE